MKRALISVWDKSGIIEFATGLAKAGWEIISTGGTFRKLTENGINCIKVSDVTGFPEILDGRVKTLHPKIHGGLLGRRDSREHVEQMKEMGIDAIDMVVVNLYPFEETIAGPDTSFEDAVEMIDIGGPTMIRSAAKNFKDVIVVTDPGQYEAVLSSLQENGDLGYEERKKLAASVFAKTASYDAAISDYLGEDLFPDKLSISFNKFMDLRYGENPHQKAAVYAAPEKDPSSLVNAEILWGKPLSYNNMMDAESCVNLTYSFNESVCTVMKHSNPCGVGMDGTPAEAYRRALSTDPMSAYGGIVAFNRPIDAESAAELRTAYVEVLIAPDFSDEALEILKKKKNLRILRLPGEDFGRYKYREYRAIRGGMLVQEFDDFIVSPDDLKVVTERKPGEDELKELLFAWNVVKTVKSNAIVLGNETGTVGIGAGQMSRVDSVKFAKFKADAAGLDTKGCVLASDAYFPFRDNIDEAHKIGVKAIIQPGGSIRDQEVIDACNEYGIAMVFTGIRHFRH